MAEGGAPTKAHVRVALVHEEVELVALEHHLEVRQQVGLPLGGLLLQGGAHHLQHACRRPSSLMPAGSSERTVSVRSVMYCRKLISKPAGFSWSRVMAQKPSVR
jgi:hypothetical protein